MSPVNHNILYKCLEVNNTSVRFLVDTGSPVSCTSSLNGRAQMVSQFNNVTMVYASIRGHSVEVIGIAECQVVDIKSNTTFAEGFTSCSPVKRFWGWI